MYLVDKQCTANCSLKACSALTRAHDDGNIIFAVEEFLSVDCLSVLLYKRNVEMHPLVTSLVVGGLQFGLEHDIW